jgi:hypothetical protein
MRVRRLLLAAAAVAAATLGGLGIGHAAPGDTGTIYYSASGSIWKMNPDGTGKTVLPVADGGFPEPSYALHGGKRWFLRSVGGYVQDRVLVAEPDDGSAPVTLVATGGVGSHFDWARDDAFVSYDAIDFDAPGGPSAHVYRVAIAFDAAGAPYAAAAPVAVVDTAVQTTGGITATMIYGISWSPTGDRVAFGERVSQNGPYVVRVKTLSTGVTATIVSDANHPVWSPDGARILVTKSTSLVSVTPSGTNPKTVLKADSKSAFLAPLDWSPDGAAVVFTKYARTAFPPKKDVWRVSSTGSSAKDLTPDVSAIAFPMGWR